MDLTLPALCGPSSSARLAATSSGVRAVLVPRQWEAWRLQAPWRPAVQGPLPVEELSRVLSTSCPELLAGRRP